MKKSRLPEKFGKSGYNGGMQLLRKRPALLLGMVCLIFLSAFLAPLPQTAPTGYDLVVAVNEYRASQGYYPFNPNSLVAAAAQAHADWIVATGQGGHIGLNGSDETMRVSWTGYGGGAAIRCDEAWAGALSIEEAIYQSWSDWTHQEVMLNAWGNRYTDAGGGVALRANGRYVFVLDVCMVVGKGSSAGVPATTAGPLATADLSNYIFGVVTATPQADGSIRHRVLYGQTLAGIAEAYGITIDQLRSLNNIAAESTIIWPDQELLIQPANASPIPTPTLLALTPTPLPTPTIPSSPLPTPTRIAVQGIPLTNNITWILAGVAAIGLLMILFSVLFKK